MPAQGLQNIPAARIPDRWDPAWFGQYIREVLRYADTRNAIEGPGIVIDGTPDVPATISSSDDIIQLTQQAYVLATPSAYLPNERILEGEADVISITDEGPGGDIIVGVEYNGIDGTKFRKSGALSVVGNPVNIAGNVQDLSAAVVGDVLHVFDIGGGNPYLGFNNTPIWTGQHTWQRNNTAVWAYVRFTDESGANAPPGRIAHDDLGSIHISSNANYAGTANNFTQDDAAIPSFMSSINQQFDAFEWHSAAAGAGTINWNNASAIMRLTLGGLLQVLAPGSASTPAVSINGTGTGMWYDSGAIHFSVSGTEQFNASGSQFDAGGRFRTQAYSASLPAYSFFAGAGSPTTSGMYYIPSHILGFATNATLRAAIGATEMQLPADSYKLQIGVGQDLNLYHDGTNSIIENDTGALRILSGGDLLVEEGQLALQTVGKGLSIKEGSNAKMGTATLVAGTVTVATTAVTANSRIFLTVNGGTLTNVAAIYESARVAGTSFTITSMNILDASNVAWMIVEPS